MGMTDVPGQALYDYWFRLSPGKLWIHNKYGPKEEMPVAVYFRKEAQMPEMELLALQQCHGSILDIGAGAGSHALLLQERGADVTALEISPKAAEVMKQRGVEKIVVEDIFAFKGPRFTTLLLLMNGIGLAGTIDGLKQFLHHARGLLAENGQLIFDSSDVAYLYEGNLPETNDYYGEIRYRYEYKKQKTSWFNWLYIDKSKLVEIAEGSGWKAEILFEDEHDQYLAKLVLKN